MFTEHKVKVKVTKFCIVQGELINVSKHTKFDRNSINSTKDNELSTKSVLCSLHKIKVTFTKFCFCLGRKYSSLLQTHRV